MISPSLGVINLVKMFGSILRAHEKVFEDYETGRKIFFKKTIKGWSSSFQIRAVSKFLNTFSFNIHTLCEREESSISFPEKKTQVKIKCHRGDVVAMYKVMLLQCTRQHKSILSFTAE